MSKVGRIFSSSFNLFSSLSHWSICLSLFSRISNLLWTAWFKLLKSLCLFIACCYAVLNWQNLPCVAIWFSDSFFFSCSINQSFVNFCVLWWFTHLFSYFLGLGCGLRPLLRELCFSPLLTQLPTQVYPKSIFQASLNSLSNHCAIYCALEVQSNHAINHTVTGQRK